MEIPAREMKKVVAYLRSQMFDERTEWNHGNEYDKASVALDVLNAMLCRGGKN